MFKNITLLVTHYNRSYSLKRLLESFTHQDIHFGDIVVSDDGSNSEHLNNLRELAIVHNFKLVESPENRGLGNNINKGQDLVQTPYTLYIQEDFEPTIGYSVHLKNALQIMEDRPDIDIMRFYAYFKYPYLKSFRYGFSEMIFKIWYPGFKKFHMYSDHPHLRRSNFLSKFGRYAEGLKGDRTEFLMAISFLKNKGKAMLYEDFKGLFSQVNSQEEPTTMSRSSFRMSSNPFVSFGRMIYRNVKHHFELMMFKPTKI